MFLRVSLRDSLRTCHVSRGVVMSKSSWTVGSLCSDFWHGFQVLFKSGQSFCTQKKSLLCMLQKVSKYSKRGHKSLSYTEYWSRLPKRNLFILSPSTYAVLDPLLPSNSLHAPRGTMLEMLGRSSNQFSAWHTGRRTSLISPPTRSTGSGRLRGTCPSRALQPTRPWRVIYALF